MSNKTITLIELFNKMASFDEQENLPEKIKYRNCVFTIIYGEGISPDYMNENSESLLEYVAAQADDLNEIVEIEEQEEINIQNIQELVFNNDNANLKNPSNLLINELVKAVKQLDRNIKEK